MLVSAVHIPFLLSLPPFPPAHPSMSSQGTRLGSLCYTATSYWLSVLHLMYMYIGEGSGTPLQYSCLENPMDGGAW